ncbi:MAG: hypothetical protein DPW16_06185 [Chloroflexi bacterium]|nr:hypothetical protein [Chloroflexota bacterium]
MVFVFCQQGHSQKTEMNATQCGGFLFFGVMGNREISMFFIDSISKKAKKTNTRWRRLARQCA